MVDCCTWTRTCGTGIQTTKMRPNGPVVGGQGTAWCRYIMIILLDRRMYCIWQDCGFKWMQHGHHIRGAQGLVGRKLCGGVS